MLSVQCRAVIMRFFTSYENIGFRIIFGTLWGRFGTLCWDHFWTLWNLIDFGSELGSKTRDRMADAGGGLAAEAGASS